MGSIGKYAVESQVFLGCRAALRLRSDSEKKTRVFNLLLKEFNYEPETKNLIRLVCESTALCRCSLRTFLSRSFLFSSHLFASQRRHRIFLATYFRQIHAWPVSQMKTMKIICDF